MDPRKPPAPARPARPHPPGTIIGKVPANQTNMDSPRLTPMEQAVYDKMGVTPAEVPDLTKSAAAQRITAQVLKIKESGTKLMPNEQLPQPVKPLQMPPERDISELSPEEQQEIHALKAKFAQQRALDEKKKLPEALARIPGMKETMATALESDGYGGIEIVDDRGQSQFDPRKQAAKPVANPTPNPTPPIPESTPETDTGSNVPLATNCPNCGFEISNKPIEIDEFDRAAFLQEAILGGKRFRKEYWLFGRRIRVVFRSLLPSESALARKQAEADLLDKKILSTLGYMEVVSNYRMLMGIDSITRVGHEPEEYSEVGSFDVPENAVTVLPALHAYFTEKVYNTESLERVIGQHWAKFNRLMERLEAQADNENFYSAVDSAS